MNSDNPKIEDEMIEAAILSANDFGTPESMFHPDYGWIFKDGKLTQDGRRFFDDNNDRILSEAPRSRCKQ